MKWSSIVGLAAAVATAQSTPNAIVRDPDTGLTFTSNFQLYKADGRGITFRVAIPENAESYTSFDVVVQAIIPNDVGWAGLAWGGSMPRNPLLVAWRGSSNNVVLSGRMANGYVMPQPSNVAQYTLIPAGTKSNGTHWQYTALCRGCTAWQQTNGAYRYLSPRGGNRLAFAYSPSRPFDANNPSSSIPIHEVHGYWSQDFAAARNPDFENIVSRLTS
ncbi:hypothetical protein VTJ49DRAFT_3298 [Mycothermus thermophilus]|uniref:Cellobiose dehydrogenase-like cytochrome domain-containing protein n=1 Tax=Humicola insolens TaxID=85995 RepID=A0ABR3V8I1_HUMIN